jgi:hypothetical protein
MPVIDGTTSIPENKGATYAAVFSLFVYTPFSHQAFPAKQTGV